MQCRDATGSQANGRMECEGASCCRPFTANEISQQACVVELQASDGTAEMAWQNSERAIRMRGGLWQRPRHSLIPEGRLACQVGAFLLEVLPRHRHRLRPQPRPVLQGAAQRCAGRLGPGLAQACKAQPRCSAVRQRHGRKVALQPSKGRGELFTPHMLPSAQTCSAVILQDRHQCPHLEAYAAAAPRMADHIGTFSPRSHNNSFREVPAVAQSLTSPHSKAAPVTQGCMPRGQRNVLCPRVGGQRRVWYLHASAPQHPPAACTACSAHQVAGMPIAHPTQRQSLP